MRLRTIAAVTVAAAALALALALAGCGGTPPPSPAACKTAMQAQYTAAIASGQAARPDTEPSACKGLPPSTLVRIASEILDGSTP
jgi:hypothetical protein